MKKKWNVIGFYENSTEILFENDGNFIKIKSTLPKASLVANLGIDARTIDRSLRDEILNLASMHGRKFKVYSLDNENWQKDNNFYQGEGFKIRISYEYFKYVSLEEKNKLPFRLPEESYKEIFLKIEKERK
jgi:hypothetical protein